MYCFATSNNATACQSFRNNKTNFRHLDSRHPLSDNAQSDNLLAHMYSPYDAYPCPLPHQLILSRWSVNEKGGLKVGTEGVKGRQQQAATGRTSQPSELAIEEGNIQKRRQRSLSLLLGGSILFLAALAIFHHDSLKFRMKSSYSSNRPGGNHPILHIVQEQNIQRGKELYQFCLPSSSDDLCLLFCLNPSSMGEGELPWNSGNTHIMQQAY